MEELLHLSLSKCIMCFYINNFSYFISVNKKAVLISILGFKSTPHARQIGSRRVLDLKLVQQI